MKIVVCLKEVLDPRINLDFGLTSEVVFREGRPFKLDPSNAKALSLALALKSDARFPDIQITTVSIGPERVERYLRDSMALGADKSVRIWDSGMDALSPCAKAQLLTRAITISGADLVLVGARSLDTGSGLVGPLVAAGLEWPCASEVTSLELENEQKAINLIRDTGGGKLERLRCSLPAVIAVRGEARLEDASLDALIDSKYAEVALITPADLGIPRESWKAEPSRITRLVFPRPALGKTPPLDSSLPAFYRILQLLEGGIARRKGVILQGGSEELAEQVFNLLKEQGVIKPA